MDLLHEGCPLINPINEIKREDLPEFMAALLEMEPDLSVVPTMWAETDDGVIFEWVNQGTLNGKPLELRGVDRYVLEDGKATAGYAYSIRGPSSRRNRRIRRVTVTPRPLVREAPRARAG
jgi:hypothetical protein